MGREVRLQLAAVVQLEQQLADVIGALGDALERPGRPRAPRISRASRLSISVQLVALPTMIVSSSVRCSAAPWPGAAPPCGRRRTGRWTAAAGRSSPAWGRRPRSRCARGSRRPSRPPTARSTRCRSRGSRRPCVPALAGSVARLRAHVEKRRPANVGAGASRCTPSSFSPRIRTGLKRSVQVRDRRRPGCPPGPSQVGRVMIRSRSGKPFWRLSLLRAWALISAILTPWGQTCEQIPHPEQ